MPGPVPEGVAHLSRIPIDQLPRLYAEHDLYVMPSRFEAFGIAFVEALSHGLPCIGRNSCAMPDLIRNGDNGYLAETEDPEELHALLVTALGDRGLWQRVSAQAPSVVARHSWANTAARILDIAARSVSPALCD
jgi:glycosyltransferase involved in cell wall biosynthesis